MSVGLSSVQKLENLVAGDGRIYGILRQGSPRSATIPDGSNKYTIKFTRTDFTEMTAFVPDTEDGRELLLSPIITQWVSQNILIIYDESELPDNPTTVTPKSVDSRPHASGVVFNGATTGADADDVQEALDLLITNNKQGTVECTDGIGVVDLSESPYQPFPTGSMISVTATPTGSDSNIAVWVDDVTVDGFTITCSDSQYAGSVNWMAQAVLVSD